MIRFAALLATTLFCTNALADGIETHSTASASTVVSTEPGEGRVALSIDVTESRRVMVRDEAAPSQLRFVCTTPCRVYVAPGNVDVTLVGWGSHEYHWDVPMHGGSVHLRANPMPVEVAAARAVMEHRLELEAAARATVMFSLVFGLTPSLALLGAIDRDASL